MTTTENIVNFCNQRTNLKEIKDFPGAFNGLQIQNSGTVTKVGASVDAGLIPFQKAISKGIDFIITHHGLFWTPPVPITGTAYKKIKLCINHNLAVYGSHLPLDCHREIGNNAILSQKLELLPLASFLPYEGVDIGLIVENTHSIKDLSHRLKSLFPKGIDSMEFGTDTPSKIAILTGSGQSAVDKILDAGTDTLITGELKQHHFNLAQEHRLNLYACGHYATETFGVNALAQEVSDKFDLPYEFIETECPL
ncbi:MAG: Nif3-like dinuclear metal center hexameric protein [Opitutae bacterium]|mgnify:CR=1 FL=1|jgi:dinuclear metal center YbgI/SA1388 family protein|nr:Nif3-like dinuclear metal center hexameric protein [Opitutae bacterium]MBT5717223.1 Nif3-like dinuclear metal center hexameric protein [Opitutae bacterium]